MGDLEVLPSGIKGCYVKGVCVSGKITDNQALLRKNSLASADNLVT